LFRNVGKPTFSNIRGWAGGREGFPEKWYVRNPFPGSPVMHSLAEDARTHFLFLRETIVERQRPESGQLFPKWSNK